MSNKFIAKFRLFDKVECCFDIADVFGNNVAIFGNNIERNFVLSTKSKQIKHVEFVPLSKKRNFDAIFDFVEIKESFDLQ